MWPGLGLLPYQVASSSSQLFGHNRHGLKIGGGDVGPHLTQYGLGQGLPPYQVSSLSIHPFGHNTWAENCGEGCCAPFFGGWSGSPSNTMLPGPRYLPYQVASWSFQPFNHNRHGPKIGGGGCSPFGGAGSPSNTMWPGPKPTSVPTFVLIHPTVWPQYTNFTDRRTDKDNGPIA